MNSYKPLFPLILLLTGFQLSACAVMPGIWSSTTERSKESSGLQVEENSNTIVHQLAHPIEGHIKALPRKYTKEPEISMRMFLTHRAHSGQINALAISRFGDEAFSGGQDGKVVRSRIISHESNRAAKSVETRVLAAGKRPILSLSLSPDESMLAVAQFSALSIYDIRKNKIIHRLDRIKGRILSLAWDPRGELLALGRANGDVYVWKVDRGLHAGENNTEALEQYGSGSSPIVALQFHPSGRSFFSAERRGIVSFWQLLRTEEELGMLDKRALIDRSRRGKQRVVLAQLASRIEDIWQNQDGSNLFISTAEGNVYRWLIRGAQNDGALFVGSDASGSIYGMSLASKKEKTPLLITSGRGQRLKFWCQRFEVDENDPRYAIYGTTGVQVIEEEPPEPAESGPNLPPEVVGDLEPLSESDEKNEVEAETPPLNGFIGRSALFAGPLTLLGSGSRSTLLWAAEKTGNLLTFDASSLLNSPRWRGRMDLCRAANNKKPVGKKKRAAS